MQLCNIVKVTFGEMAVEVSKTSKLNKKIAASKVDLDSHRPEAISTTLKKKVEPLRILDQTD